MNGWNPNFNNSKVIFKSHIRISTLKLHTYAPYPFFFCMTNYLVDIPHSCNTMTIGKKLGKKKTQGSTCFLVAACTFDKCYAFAVWAHTIIMTKVNSAALRVEPANADLVVAIISYSVTHAYALLIICAKIIFRGFKFLLMVIFLLNTLLIIGIYYVRY